MPPRPRVGGSQWQRPRRPPGVMPHSMRPSRRVPSFFTGNTCTITSASTARGSCPLGCSPWRWAVCLSTSFWHPMNGHNARAPNRRIRTALWGLRCVLHDSYGGSCRCRAVQGRVRLCGLWRVVGGFSALWRVPQEPLRGQTSPAACSAFAPPRHVDLRFQSWLSAFLCRFVFFFQFVRSYADAFAKFFGTDYVGPHHLAHWYASGACGALCCACGGRARGSTPRTQ